MNIDMLDEAWVNYHTDETDGIFKDQRFGQYVYNNYNIEVDNSFYEEDNDLVYEMLFDFLLNKEVL